MHIAGSRRCKHRTDRWQVVEMLAETVGYLFLFFCSASSCGPTHLAVRRSAYFPLLRYLRSRLREYSLHLLNFALARFMLITKFIVAMLPICASTTFRSLQKITVFICVGFFDLKPVLFIRMKVDLGK